MKSTTYAWMVCKHKLVGGSDREQRMRETRAFSRHDQHAIDVPRHAVCSRMLVVDPI
jgi:hypothetical protein